MEPIVQLSSLINKFVKNAKELSKNLLPFVIAEVQKNIDKQDLKNSPITLKLKGSKPPLRDTGHLKASITGKATQYNIIVGTNLKHAPILHYGGQIKPRKAKKLVIPADKSIKNMTALVGVKGVIESYKEQGYEVIFLKKSIVANKKGKTKILYIRKDKVEIPSRPFMELSKNQVENLKELAKNFVFRGVS